MATKAENISLLMKGIFQDHQSYSMVLTLLEQQYRYILERNAEKLLELNKNIEVHYNHLQETASLRKKLLLALKQPCNANGMLKIISLLPSHHRIKFMRFWQEIKQFAMTCQDINRRNRLLLEKQMEILRPLMDEIQSNFIYTPTS